MSRTTCRLAQRGVLLSVVILAGCPLGPPILQVQPLAISFGGDDTRHTFRIINQGGGTLAWQITEDLAWLDLAQPAASSKQTTLEGTTTTEIDVITLTLNRALLPPGATTGQVNITSNGGEQTIHVSASVGTQAQLTLSQTQLNFGIDLQQQTFSISNTGQEQLDWTLTVSEDAPWLTVSPLSGTVLNTGPSATVSVSANRTGLAAGTYTGTIHVASTGGEADVTARMQVPPFTVLQNEIDFGRIVDPTSQLVTVSNRGFDPIALTITTATSNGGAWLSASPLSGTLDVGTPFELVVTANPTGLLPSRYTGEVRISDSVSGYERAVSVFMTVSGVAITPASIAFGSITAPASSILRIENLGAQPVTWTITVPSTAAAWLSVTPLTGSVLTTDEVTVTANPGNVQPGLYEAKLRISFEGREETVTVTMTRPKPPTLRVEPSTIDFGASRTQELVGIWNDGIGTVNWRIDSSAFPAWLSMSPVDAQGIASGVVSGSRTDTVTLRVNRANVPEGQTSAEHTFQVEASGDSSTPVVFTVRVQTPLIPRLVIEAHGTDSAGLPYVNLDVDENNATFYIRNEGNGTLFWSIDLTDRPAWLTAFTPSQGSLEPATQGSVTVSVDRTSLGYLGAQQVFEITSNDPENETASLLVEVQVEKVIIIQTRPSSLAFGLYDTSYVIEVANYGDPDTVLNFQIVPSKEWLAVYPETGSSLGVSGTIKDWQPVSVSVDRSRLDASGGSAKLTVFAYNVVEGQSVPDPAVIPAEITVAVEVAELTIENAQPRTRIPSLVRSVLLMRNIAYRAIPIPDTHLEGLVAKFSLFENDRPIELEESNQFLTPHSRTRNVALILLDYSGSMQAAARQVADPAVAGAPDPIQALYESAIPQLIDEMPDNYAVGLGVFSERGGSPVRIIREDGQSDIFTHDRALLQQRLQNIHIIDNGATVLLPALVDGALLILDEDLRLNRFPFDDADVRALICVTDGRLTTPPGNVNEYADVVASVRVRLFCIGWGAKVFADPLIRFTAKTGGHYYATQNAPTGATDAFGNAVRLPVVSELEDWCETDPSDPCDQSIPQDLRSQIVLSYVTLNQESGVSLEARATFNDPNDGTACLTEQGEISGSFTKTQLDYAAIVGNPGNLGDICLPRTGQISLHTDGIQADGSAIVTVRLDYTPRNITRLSFRFERPPSIPMQVLQIPETSGGVIPDWQASSAPPIYTYQSADGTPLTYGEFGDLLELRFQGVAAPFVLTFEVAHPTRNTADPESKYFTYADTLNVDFDSFLATSFPSPYFATTPAAISENPITLDLGTDLDEAELLIYNLGGHHVRPGAEPSCIDDIILCWEAEMGPGTGGSFVLSPKPSEGAVAGTLEPDSLTVSVGRSLDPGHYTGDVIFVFTYGALGMTWEGDPIQVQYEVLPPELTIDPDPAVLDFGTTLTQLTLTISNTGQSVLAWEIDTGAEDFPDWLVLNLSGGELAGDETASVIFTVDQSGLPAGPYSASFPLNADNGIQTTITVLMTVP